MVFSIFLSFYAQVHLFGACLHALVVSVISFVRRFIVGHNSYVKVYTSSKMLSYLAILLRNNPFIFIFILFVFKVPHTLFIRHHIQWHQMKNKAHIQFGIYLDTQWPHHTFIFLFFFLLTLYAPPIYNFIIHRIYCTNAQL